MCVVINGIPFCSVRIMHIFLFRNKSHSILFSTSRVWICVLYTAWYIFSDGRRVYWWYNPLVSRRVIQLYIHTVNVVTSAHMSPPLTVCFTWSFGCSAGSNKNVLVGVLTTRDKCNTCIRRNTKITSLKTLFGIQPLLRTFLYYFRLKAVVNIVNKDGLVLRFSQCSMYSMCLLLHSHIFGIVRNKPGWVISTQAVLFTNFYPFLFYFWKGGAIGCLLTTPPSDMRVRVWITFSLVLPLPLVIKENPSGICIWVCI